MLSFWVYFIGIGLVGLLVGLFWQFKYEHWWSKIICVVLSFMIIGFLFGGINYLDAKMSYETWNGGHCEICEGEWQLVAVAGRSYKTYYWSCEKCGNTIETSTMFK